MLFQTLDKLKRQSIMTAIVMMALGIVMLLCPENYVSALTTTFGYVMIIFAIEQVLEFLASKKAVINYIYLTSALITGIVGLAVLVFNNNILSVLGWLFGFVLVADGIHSMFHAFTYAKRSQRKGWSVLVILSALLILIGITIFIGVIISGSPLLNSVKVLMNVIGGSILFSAAVSAIKLLWIWPFRNNKGEISDGKN